MATSRTTIDEIKAGVRTIYGDGRGGMRLSHREAVERAATLTGNATGTVEEWVESKRRAFEPRNAETEMTTADGLGGELPRCSRLIGQRVQVDCTAGRFRGRLILVGGSPGYREAQIATELAPGGYFHLQGVSAIRPIDGEVLEGATVE